MEKIISKTKHITLVGSIVAVLISVSTLLASRAGWIGGKAIANEHVDTMRAERGKIQLDIDAIAGTTIDMISKMKDKNDTDHIQIAKDLIITQGDIKALNTSIERIKQFLIKNNQ